MREFKDTSESPDEASNPRERALMQSLDTRKLEIDLYWKRASYFWTLIAAAFAGYIVLVSSDSPMEGMLVLVSCIGFTLSFAWYLVNRGSKYWQENWESHVDLLEDGIIGPLYRTTISQKEYRWFRLVSGYPYSVSKVNQIISIYITMVWMGLIVHSCWPSVLNSSVELESKHVLVGLTGVFAILMHIYGRTHSEKKARRTHMNKCDLK